MHPTRPAAAALAALVVYVALPAAAGELVPNPDYVYWSKFKKGTSVSYKTAGKAGIMSVNSVSTQTLVEVGGDKIVLELTTTQEGVAKPFTTTRSAPKMVELPAGMSKKDSAAEKERPAGTTAEGTEVLKVAGREYKTRWYRYATDAGGDKLEGKLWLSDEVPGKVVRSETKITGKIVSTMTMELTGFKTP